jgi:hypothetical protein
MKVVNLPNIDSKIWNLEHKVLDIVSALMTGDNLVITLNNEGVCAESVGLYKLLDDISERFQIDPKKISIETANAIEKSDKYKILHSSMVHLANHRRLQFESNKSFNKDLKHFGIFIGRSNWNRLYLAATIFKNFKEKSILSFHYNTDVKDTNCGFDALSFFIGTDNTTKLCNDLLSQFPIKLDVVDQYPIVNPAYFNILKKYNNIFLDVVCETYFTGNTFFPTEKTVRPLVSSTPFLLFGPKHYLSNLKKLGFKTFSDYWSEDYDNHDKLYRVQEIEKILVQLSDKSISELEIMYNHMLPILEHNKNLLTEITEKKFYDQFK